MIATAMLSIVALAAFGGSSLGGARQDLTVEELMKSVPVEVRLDRKPIPNADNGWLTVQQPAEPRPDRDLMSVAANEIPARAKDFAVKLKPLNPHLDDLVAASKLSGWLEPAPNPKLLPGMEFPRLAAIKQNAKLLVLRGRVRMALGQHKAALDDLEACLRIGAGVERGSNSLISWFVGAAVEAIALGAIDEVMSNRTFTREDAQGLLRAIPPPPVDDAGMQNALRGEICTSMIPLVSQTMGDPVRGMSAGSPQRKQIFEGLTGLYDPKDLVVQASRGCAIAIKDLEGSWPERRKVATLIEELRKGWPEALDRDRSFTENEVQEIRSQLMLSPDPIGRGIAATFLSTFDDAVKVSFRARTRQTFTRTCLALKIWSLDHKGGFPAALQELVTAKIVAAIPVDPFAGKPLMYDRARAILWSVGPNGIDDQGSGTPGLMPEGDLDFVWPITKVRP